MIQLKSEEFSELLFNGYDYKLPDSVIENLDNLVSELGININSTSVRNSEASSSSGFKKPHQSVFKRSKSSSGMTTTQNTNDDAWGRMKEFKTTKIEKKEGTEKIFNEIRGCLNKISEKSYQSQLENIKQFIKEVIGEDEINDDTTKLEFLEKIAIFIVDVASSNKLNSVLYSNLYKELMLLYPVFRGFIDNILGRYIESIKNIKYVDHNIDYDLFCDNNKENDKRKAVVVFMINLMNIDVLTKENIRDIILCLQDQLLLFMQEQNRVNEVDEITENIFIFITMLGKTVLLKDEWSQIINNIEKMSKYKTKDNNNLSSRALFKYMDMLDIIRK